MIIRLIFLFQLFVINIYAQDKHADKITNQIIEERFIQINGIEQWVTIKGDSTKPVILFLHGGPGSPLSPYTDAIYSEWEKDFILVQWDQRGAGKTFGFNAPAELDPDYLKAHPLTIEQMTADGIVLVNYLLTHLNKKKDHTFWNLVGFCAGSEDDQEKPGTILRLYRTFPVGRSICQPVI